MDALSTGLQMALGWQALIAVAAGSVIGVIFGAIPGLTFSMALAL
jgi:putative tricarboxylic transport membrane protein